MKLPDWVNKVFPKNDPVRRRNAGRVSGNAPLIITGGSERHKEFQYQFTDPGKFEKKPKQGTVKLPDDAVTHRKRTELMDKLRYVLPNNFCPDCNKTDVMADAQGRIGAINIVTIDDPEPGLDIRPGEHIATIWCQSCQEQDIWGRKNIELPTSDGDDDLDEYRLKQVRQVRMQRNIMEFIRAARNSGKGDRIILGDGEKGPLYERL